jgi:Cu-Zn family superoxide dismutase
VAHAGDLGNLEADPSGHGMLNLVIRRIPLGEGDRSVLGRAVIVHQGQDDLRTQPTGAAGARVACGVILREGDGTPRVLPR